MNHTELKKEIRLQVNDLFQDADAEGRISTDLANIICSLHTDKIMQLLTKHEESLVTRLKEAKIKIPSTMDSSKYLADVYTNVGIDIAIKLLTTTQEAEEKK